MAKLVAISDNLSPTVYTVFLDLVTSADKLEINVFKSSTVLTLEVYLSVFPYLNLANKVYINSMIYVTFPVSNLF